MSGLKIGVTIPQVLVYCKHPESLQYNDIDVSKDDKNYGKK